MRRTMFALTVIFLAPTAVMASTAGRELVGSSGLEAAGTTIQKLQVARDAVAGSDHAERNVILAKGDKSGTGPGHGGHKGAKKAEHKGGQAKGKDKGGQKPKS
jgi:hypothetical protein